MNAQLIDGRAIARELKADLAAEVEHLRNAGVAGGLASVVVGDNFSSVAYERRLRRLAAEFHVPYRPHRLAAVTTEEDLISLVREVQHSPEISGVLILRPLPEHIDEARVFRALDPLKDIEAVHPENAGLLSLGAPRYVPSTAASVFHLLDSWLDSVGDDREDFYHRSRIVVVGRSNNVGKPAISLGHARQAAVESVDEWASRTLGLGRHTRQADVLIVAAGRPAIIKAEHVSEQAVVIDVGINPAMGPDGRVHMVGDVDFESVAPRVRAITPVPGGVGPVTDVWLLRNTVAAARLLVGLPAPQTALTATYPAHELMERS